MLKFMMRIMWGLIYIVVFSVVAAYAMLLLNAFWDGLEQAFGFGALGKLICTLAALFTHPLGTFTAMCFACYGMISDWHIPWWGALLLSFPTFALMPIMFAAGGIMNLYDKARERMRRSR